MEITAATAPDVATRAYMRHALDTGARIWLTYGSIGEVEGFVLTTGQHQSEIQDAGTGEIKVVAHSAITEMTEAS